MLTAFADQIKFLPNCCWKWLGGVTGGASVSYGYFIGAAHRWSYEKFVGPIPEGFDVHHKCEFKLCVNPTHLEALSPSDHMRLHARHRAQLRKYWLTAYLWVYAASQLLTEQNKKVEV